ncbi:MAG: amidohydrolase family protein [Phycisphaerae bacterium]|nr:amidohydrolase family protein [Phycisphaerae bacterium]
MATAETHPQVIAADWLIAMDSDTPRAIRNGGVRVGGDGRITAVGLRDDILQPGDSLTVLPNAVLTPGLVNAHAHLDMSYWRGHRDSLAGRPLHEWVKPIMAERLIRPARDVAAAAADGARESLACGVTTVVDVTPASIAWREVFDAVAAIPIRRIALAELVGFGERGEQSWSAFSSLGTGHSALGTSPHAPYSAGASLYARCLAAAVANDLPLMTHLSETREEVEFCLSGGGPWRDLLERLGAAADVTIPGCSPVEYAARLGLLDYPRTLLAHVNYLAPGDLERLASGRATVVYCPRTAELFGHRDHPWRRLAAAGVNVAVGTDSLASSPDLSVLGELRFLHERFPEVRAGELLAMATRNARQREAGMLVAGAAADIVAWPIGAGGDDADAILDGVLETADRPMAVFVDGRRV